MGAFHGAQACEIVGLFLLDKLKTVPNFLAILYRDDGLGVTTSSARLQNKQKNVGKKKLRSKRILGQKMKVSKYCR